MARLPNESDLIEATENICRRQGIETASFQIFGAVSLLTIGTFDQAQQVYVTDRQEGPFEIVFCSGNVSRQAGRCYVNSRIIAADIDGHLVGGRVFSFMQPKSKFRKCSEIP